MVTNQSDIVSRLMAYEEGELDQDQVIDLFQELLSSGLITQLQGHYGRTAQRLIDAGLIGQPTRVFGERIN